MVNKYINTWCEGQRADGTLSSCIFSLSINSMEHRGSAEAGVTTQKVRYSVKMSLVWSPAIACRWEKKEKKIMEPQQWNLKNKLGSVTSLFYQSVCVCVCLGRWHTQAYDTECGNRNATTPKCIKTNFVWVIKKNLLWFFTVSAPGGRTDYYRISWKRSHS